VGKRSSLFIVTKRKSFIASAPGPPSCPVQFCQSSRQGDLVVKQNTTYQNTIYKNAIDRDTLSQNIMHQNTIYQSTIDKYTIHKHTIHQNTIDQTNIDKNIIDNRMFVKCLQWMVSFDSVLRVVLGSSAGCSASHLTMAPLSSRLTGRTSLDNEIQVLEFSVGLLFSWLCPEAISSLPMNHFSLAGGLAPVAMHSSSRSSPAAAVISEGLASSPTRWMTTLLGGSV
jgi:hypothetical protein